MPGTATAAAIATRRARPPVAARGMASDPAALGIGRMFDAPRAMTTPSIGPSNNPLIPARLTKVRRRARASSVDARSPITANATGVTAAANKPLRNRSA